MLLDAWKLLPRPLRRLIVSVIGGTVLLVGIAMIVTPGPAALVIPAGLAILSGEFLWARRLLKRYKDLATKAAAKIIPKRPPGK